MTSSNESTEVSFKEAYQVLQKHAQSLRNNNEPNIDDLLTIVNESMNAYKTCKTRIEAVEKALSEALQGEDIDFGASDTEQNTSESDDDLPPF